MILQEQIEKSENLFLKMTGNTPALTSTLVLSWQKVPLLSFRKPY